MTKAAVATFAATVAVAAPPLRALEPVQPLGETKVSTHDHAQSLVDQMTLEEKVSLVSTYFPLFSAKAKEYGMKPSAGFNPGISRLGIPPLRESDASLGVANALNKREGDTATALPSGLATAATFDPALARAGGTAIGAEARAKTFNVLLAGGVNLTRDPWAGRNFEYLGEDPLLAGLTSGASIAGIQSNKIASTIKHFVLNSQETGRMVADAQIAPAALRESDLLAFEIALEQGNPASVMCAYNKVNGEYTCENDALLNGVLKGDWGFKGWVMSDWGAVHSTEKAALSGLDQESGIELDMFLNGSIAFTDKLLTAVKDGAVPQARLDDMVRRILTGMIDSGLLDIATPATDQPIDYDAHANVAQRIAESGVVLLRNEGHVLPLQHGTKHIVVIGGHADVGVLSGGGSSQVRSVGGAPVEIPVTSGEAAMFSRRTWHASSPLKAIQAISPGSDVSFVDGSDVAAAAKAASNADVAIVFATQWQTEGVDAETLALPDNQDALIEAVASANRKTIVVLENGGPVLMPWLAHVPAVLGAWYPGQRGAEAIARVLFGNVNPSGRLPITFPSSDSQAPRPKPVGLEQLAERDRARAAGDVKAKIATFPVVYNEGANVGYRWYEVSQQKPLFPFGYGLSYTEFHYSNLRVVGGRTPSVTLDVTNTGRRSGADVAQVYVRAADSSGAVTWRLAGFGRVELAPGVKKRISIPLERRSFSHWDMANNRWMVADGELPLAVGRSSTDFVLHGAIKPAISAAR